MPDPGLLLLPVPLYVENPPRLLDRNRDRGAVCLSVLNGVRPFINPTLSNRRVGLSYSVQTAVPFYGEEARQVAQACCRI